MPLMFRQCATTAITAVCAASIMFATAAMLSRLVAQFKMPRLDAYVDHPGVVIEDGDDNRQALRLNLCNVPDQRDAMAVGQGQIDEQHLWSQRIQQAKSLGDICGRAHNLQIIGTANGTHKGVPKACVVLDDEH